MRVIQTVDTVETWRKTLDAERSLGRTVGLVPTMGFLHDGHASLIRRATAENDVVGLTLFVNPLQFSATEDLADYPRDFDADRALAQECEASYLFAPSVEEMYPQATSQQPLTTTVSVGELADRWEGVIRPTHFAGVATVVTKLFAQAGPCRAYFGEKDFQQLAVIRRLVADLSLPVDVIGCPTVREPDGLALSSRNVYLTADERAVASRLHQSLLAGARTAARLGATPGEVNAAMSDCLADEPRFALDYAAVVDAATLAPATDPTDLADLTAVRLIIAARLGRARLIDNIGVFA